MSVKKKLLQAAAGNVGGGGGLNVEDVFSTYLYEGNDTSQTITNDIDLDGEGGMVWIKNRSASTSHVLFDTERGANLAVSSNLDSAENDTSNSGYLSSLNSNGFTVNNGTSNGLRTNEVNDDFVSWTFRKAPKFFDVVEVTVPSAGTDQIIRHGLDAPVGFVITKGTSATSDWYGFHTAKPNKYFKLSGTDAEADWTWSSTNTEIDIGTFWSTNFSGQKVLFYFFADNDGDGEFGPDGDQDIIKCGSWNHSGNTEVDLGFEPQWILTKDNGSGGWWTVWDSMRGLADAPNGTAYLAPHLNHGEATNAAFRLTPTGFIAKSAGFPSREIIYIAIRRGTKVPESGAEVFGTDNYTGGGDGPVSGIVTDMAILGMVTASDKFYLSSRLNGERYMRPNTTATEVTQSNNTWDRMDGAWNSNVNGYMLWGFRRAPKFLDVVGYYGNGTAGHNVSHNLGVAPEMMWVKRRDAISDWQVYHSGVDTTAPENYFLALGETNARTDSTTRWNDTAPTSTEFTLGARSDVNANGGDLVAYLFASLDGVSKVGSYTGTGAAQTIDCGFDGGPSFVIIKCATADSNENWYLYDAERGINPSGTADKRLSLNNTTAEVSVDEINPTASGFEITGNNTPNVSGEEYIFYAIA